LLSLNLALPDPFPNAFQSFPTHSYCEINTDKMWNQNELAAIDMSKLHNKARTLTRYAKDAPRPLWCGKEQQPPNQFDRWAWDRGYGMQWGFDGYGDEDSQAGENVDLLVVLQQKTARLLLECQCALAGVEPPVQVEDGYGEYRAFGGLQESECTWIDVLTRDADDGWSGAQTYTGRSDSEEDGDELSIIEMYTSS